MKIVTNGRAKITVNGKEIGTIEGFAKVFIDPEPIKAVELKYEPYPYHTCLDCGDGWMFSTNDNKCLGCGGTNIKHENV